MKAKIIVCPVDFSDASNAALDLASKLARENGAKMYILHVLESTALIHAGVMADLPPSTQATRDKLNATLPTATEVQFEHDILVGLPAEKIVEFAREKQADLIVMGTHGATGLVRLLMGSVAEGVVRHAPMPVLSLKALKNEASEAKA